MKYLFFAMISFALFWSCKNEKKSPPVTEMPEVKTDSTLITDSSWGIIQKSADFEKLQQLFGAFNVKDERICGPECADTINVTKIYSDKKNEIVVYWNDSFYHKKIVLLESSDTASPFHTAYGLKIGSTMNDLLRLNGQKISFSGFDWDYGGMIQSFNNGALEKSKIHFRLGLSGDYDGGLSGDMELNTDMPIVKKALAKILIGQISLAFNND